MEYPFPNLCQVTSHQGKKTNNYAFVVSSCTVLNDCFTFCRMNKIHNQLGKVGQFIQSSLKTNREVQC